MTHFIMTPNDSSRTPTLPTQLPTYASSCRLISFVIPLLCLARCCVAACDDNDDVAYSSSYVYPVLAVCVICGRHSELAANLAMAVV